MSKIGISLAAVYLIIVVGLFIYSQNCSGMFCGFVFIIVLMPWNFLEEALIGYSRYEFIFGVLNIAINAGIFYFIGHLISKLRNRNQII